MPVFFNWVVLGLFIAVVVASIRHFRQLIRKRAAAAAVAERRRAKWKREFEQIRSSSCAPLYSAAKAKSARFRVVK